MSTRDTRRARRAKKRRQRQARMVGIAVLGLTLVGVLIWASNRPSLPGGGEFATPLDRDRPYAEGKTLGSPDAPVVIEEYSDFQ